ncbi:MAG: tyrosine recombinase XerC [Prevotellaceae bacterium]|jgi:integrase/recombinase XerC|nr:tyrosine recombinase XerC [Prevotellaceae bacterium]
MIDLFLKYLQYEKNYSSHTVLSYKTDLEEFEAFVSEQNGSFNPPEIEDKNIREWIVSLMDTGIVPRSVNRKISALRSFYRFLLQRGLVATNPAKAIKALKTEKNLPLFFKESELDRVLDDAEIDENDFEACRNRLIIDMFYETGIRLSELVNLKDSDVDLSANTLKVLGKRNKERIVPFGNTLRTNIIMYRKLRNEIPNRDYTLYIKKNGEKMYPRLVYQIVHDAMTAQSSLSKRSPHVLRHTFATSVLNAGAELNAVKEILGHASLAATQVYTHTTFEQLRNIYKKAHPRE